MVPQTPDPSVPVALGDRGHDRAPCPRASRSIRTPPTGRPPATTTKRPSGPREAATAPSTSKVGTDVIDSSALPGPISGAIYLGQPQPGNRYRHLPHRRRIRDAREARAAPSSRTPADRPARRSPSTTCRRSPFQDFSMHFFGSERGLLATPTQCGTYPVNTEFTPWDTELSNTALALVLHRRLRARTAPPARRSRGPSSRASSPGPSTTPPGCIRPSRSRSSERRRPEPRARST